MAMRERLSRPCGGSLPSGKINRAFRVSAVLFLEGSRWKCNSYVLRCLGNLLLCRIRYIRDRSFYEDFTTRFLGIPIVVTRMLWRLKFALTKGNKATRKWNRKLQLFDNVWKLNYRPILGVNLFCRRFRKTVRDLFSTYSLSRIKFLFIAVVVSWSNEI